jgi:lipopolysaccharide/colanic/teichoic acid biosynthesis glycosyltransferase
MAYLIKTICDRGFALLGLIFLSPIMLLLAVVIGLEMGTPVVFKQPRPGKHGRIFNFYKFRTMTNAVNVNGILLTDDERLTPLGSFIRKTSLDELPQLWNIVKGDMSFVGPRPLLVDYLERYTPEQFRRHNVLPGITGWAQVNGRNSISWEEKFQYDIWYVDNFSLALDLKIMIMTVLKVVNREGINQSDHVTMEKFMGSKPLDTSKTQLGK